MISQAQNKFCTKDTDSRDECFRANVPFFFKEWGGVQKKRAGRTLEGRTWDEMPIEIGLAKV
jgi:protein gp37